MCQHSCVRMSHGMPVGGAARKTRYKKVTVSPQLLSVGKNLCTAGVGMFACQPENTQVAPYSCKLRGVLCPSAWRLLGACPLQHHEALHVHFHLACDAPACDAPASTCALLKICPKRLYHNDLLAAAGRRCYWAVSEAPRKCKT